MKFPDHSLGTSVAPRLTKVHQKPLSEALIHATFAQRPAFIEMFLENGQLVPPRRLEKPEGVLLYDSGVTNDRKDGR